MKTSDVLRIVGLCLVGFGIIISGSGYTKIQKIESSKIDRLQCLKDDLKRNIYSNNYSMPSSYSIQSMVRRESKKKASLIFNLGVLLLLFGVGFLVAFQLSNEKR
ncbi:MAG: hypothetical protein GY714_33065 [Desulfobacterales bacterium]|nr:hypothetical protein [Desulfobacterales bacterium]